ncbi:hypothetical protein [Nocardia sp. NPDC056100]|uniref:hypothetical protein n=1 Tax=Nocardia sp. NPDC056100 TaxID=3345712 RepID=UPI0035DDBBD5
MTVRSRSRALAGALAVFLSAAVLFGPAAAFAADGVRANASIEGRAIAGADARNPVRLDPAKVSQVTVEVVNGTAKPVTVRRVDLAGHILGLNFFSYSTSVELTVAAGKSGKLTYRLDPAGLDGQATGLIGADLTLIGSDGKPLTNTHTVVDVRGSLVSVYGLFGIILAVLTLLAIADAALTVARHRLSANRWQRGLRLLAPGIGIGLMIGFTASVVRWWVPGTALWLSLAGATAALFFLAGYLSPTPRTASDLELDAEDLAAARELDAHGYPAGSSDLATALPGASGNHPDMAGMSANPGGGYAPAGAVGYAPGGVGGSVPGGVVGSVPGGARGFNSGGSPIPRSNTYQPGRTPSRPMPIVGMRPPPSGEIPRPTGAPDLPTTAIPGSPAFRAAPAPQTTGRGPGGTPILSPDELETLGYPAGSARGRQSTAPPTGTPPAPRGSGSETPPAAKGGTNPSAPIEASTQAAHGPHAPAESKPDLRKPDRHATENAAPPASAKASPNPSEPAETMVSPGSENPAGAAETVMSPAAESPPGENVGPAAPRESQRKVVRPSGPVEEETIGRKPVAAAESVSPTAPAGPQQKVVRPVGQVEEETIGREAVGRKPVPAGEDEPTIRNGPGEWRFRPGGAGR